MYAVLYAEAVLSEPRLLSYWRMEEDLRDEMGKADGETRGGKGRFIEGAIGGRALALDHGVWITMGTAPHLDLDETTIELFFKLLSEPPKDYNPCLISKRRSSRETRFSIHVRSDLSGLVLWNGRTSGLIILPISLVVGEWHHLLISCKPFQISAYLDGIRCTIMAVGDPCFSFPAKGLPIQIGASSPDGEEHCICAVDEVAIYGRTFTEEDVRSHIDAAGWTERRVKLEEWLRRKDEEDLREKEEALRNRLEDPSLLERGEPQVYQGERLTGIEFPVGGIGTGVVFFNGKGERHSWQIFNNFTYAKIPNSFFAIRVKEEGGRPIVRALQTSPIGQLEPMSSLRFRGEYPFGWFEFEDPALPVSVLLEAFNPLIPLRVRESAIPCAIFNLTAKNSGDRDLEVSFLATQQNAVGYTGKGEIAGNSFEGYGGNINTIIREEGATILHMTSESPPDSPAYGDMALMALAEEATSTASWEEVEELIREWEGKGAISGPDRAGPSPHGRTINGAISVSFQLKPEERRTIAFVLTWHFPNARHGDERAGWEGKGNFYSNWWRNSIEVAREVKGRFQELLRLTHLYHDTFYASNMPRWLLDRISSQVSVLRSKTCFFSQDGYFGGWEGCNPEDGCCFGNCAHVWHYAQAHARLFPEIARLMREQAFGSQRPDGGIYFRQPRHGIACDGQFGEILEAYREHLLSSDSSWLLSHWERIKRAMDFAIATWDPDEDGMLSGDQHNTLDWEMSGCSSWLGSLYLAALAASERMARISGDEESASRYRRILETGIERQNERLWNGEYYIHIPDPNPNRPFGEYGNGCHIDQVLGQWWAHQLDLGWIYPKDRVRTALLSLLRYNFRHNFRGIVQYPRKFVEDEDSGMQMTTWPKGDRPAPHVMYADEVMTGFEYSAAAMMIWAGLLKEGLVVLKAVSDRYDGRKRTGLSSASWGYSGNPFGDDECGKFYARAMSIWSVLLSMQGFIYDGPAGKLGFKPIWKPEEHSSFFTASEGWGLFEQRRTEDGQSERIDVAFGRIPLKELIFEMPEGKRAVRVDMRLGVRPIDLSFHQDGRDLYIVPKEGLVVEEGETLMIDISFR
jgi:uncharacterized protein (DUF608 family)